MATGILPFPVVVINDCQISQSIVLYNPHVQNINRRCIYSCDARSVLMGSVYVHVELLVHV